MQVAMATNLRVRKSICLVFRILTVLSAALAPSFEAAALETGTVIRDKFSLLYYTSEQTTVCEDIEYYLDQPAVFSWEDLAGSLLSTSQSLLWQKLEGGEWRSPRILGDLSEHKVPERVMVDLDQDGVTETIIRRWEEYKSQLHNQLSLFERTNFSDPKRTESLLTPKLLQSLLDKAGKGLKANSDFYFFDLIEVSSKPYVIALATIWPHAERTNRLAIVVQFAKGLQPQLACALSTKVFAGKHPFRFRSASIRLMQRKTTDLYREPLCYLGFHFTRV